MDKTNVSSCQGHCGCSAAAAVPAAPALRVSRYRIDNMDCPTEEALIRDRLGRVEGVQQLDFNLMQRTLDVHHALATAQPVEAALASIGMKAQPRDEAQARTSVLTISKMDCPTEEALIRSKLQGMPGILGLEFNLMQRKLTLHHSAQALPQALAALRAIGLGADEPDPGAALAGAARDVNDLPGEREPWWPLALSGAAALAAEAVEWLQPDSSWLVLALALVAIGSGGLSTYKKGWIALRHLNLNMNALMSIAVTGAMLIGHWPEAAMVMFLFAVAELIEAKSLDRARHAIRGLLELAPDKATVLQPDGNWTDVLASSVEPDAQVRVKPGERIALDGQIVSGRSTVNQAPITGESIPVEKAAGDKVFAGTINESGSFEYRVTARAGDSTLARIIHAVESAQGARAPTQRFVDQFARIYTPAVFAVALAVAVVPPLALGAEWLTWVYRALVLLVVACPCALVISTPVTIVSGLAAAARKGILIKGGAYLEAGRRLTAIALDKTGTLTHGKPEQTDVVALGGDEGPLRRIAASLASRSDHPVSQAISRAARRDTLPVLDVQAFSALPGYGVQGSVDGTTYQLCNPRWTEQRFGPPSQAEQARMQALEQQGKTLVLLSDQSRVLALFAVADTVKDSSRSAVAEMQALGVRTVMLTGDNPHTARAIAAQVGIDDARGHQLPEDKLRFVEEASRGGQHVGMVGDGINDAPALARADIGFAMGAAGSDTAIETADVALMDDDLRKVPAFVRLSRATARVLVQNIVLALGIKAVFLVMTFTGQATMWMAVFADMGASLLVVFNGLRLLAWSDRSPAPGAAAPERLSPAAR
ncbi:MULTISPECIES: heavy metal translocating P-type ATPase [Azohydromonas]|jgi:Cd2+/Zn2+-exporting ATPase|uniref:P-type Zn(2+) transporter n=1 Tax=Azohydromonas lata TaxID=45677 RepID=A0ABU5I9C9_9BURK|nr:MULTISPECIES: heavy metal translocating P-type ATPase [Azohydromonas]MDZ5455704.1 heavy metal translocating P-type ATPase [Azohydromonas lata]